jgi:bacterioferritin-associated ferredoxin
MYVCVCRAVTDKDIHKAMAEGATTVRELKEKLRVTESCGSCLETVRHIVKQSQSPQAA